MSYLVSVMMPAYNAESIIAVAIKSLQYQIYSNWECIIVNDGSTDRTLEIVNKLASLDPRIKVFSFEKNKGRGAARKLALEKCQGELIAMLDADDWYYPTKLNEQVNKFIENPDVDVISCRMAVVDKNSNIIGIRGSVSNQVGSFNQPSNVPMPHASTMFRKSIIGKNTYDTSLKYGQDMDFLRRILLGRKYLLINDIGYVYEEGYSNNFQKSFLSYFYSAKSYSKFFKGFKFFISLKIIAEYLKAFRLLAYYIFGRYEVAIQKRSEKPSEIEIQQFLKAKKYLHEFK